MEREWNESERIMEVYWYKSGKRVAAEVKEKEGEIPCDGILSKALDSMYTFVANTMYHIALGSA